MEMTNAQNQAIMQQLQDQLYSVEMQLQEFKGMILSLEEYSLVKEGTEILAPIGNGIFIKAKSIETNRFTINVGSNVVVEKSKDEAIEMLNTQITSLQKYRDELMKEITNV